MMKRRFDARAMVGMGAALLALFAFAAGSDLRFGAGSSGRAEAAEPQAFVAAGETAAYIQFEGIKGESRDQYHRDWINLLSFSQGQSAPATLGIGGAREVGKVVFDDLVLTKELDQSSPKLAEAVCTGQQFSKVTMHVTGALLGPQNYYVCELTGVRVTGYHIDSSTGAFPTEVLSLNFRTIEVSYTPYDETGREQGKVEYGWNVEEMKRL